MENPALPLHGGLKELEGQGSADRLSLLKLYRGMYCGRCGERAEKQGKVYAASSCKSFDQLVKAKECRL